MASGKAFYDMRPQVIQALFISTLQSTFRDHPNYPWYPDERTSKIVIRTAYAEDAKTSNIHPAIFVEQGNLTFNNDSIGNKAHIERYREYLTKDILTYTVAGSIMLTCTCDSRIAAENLAYEVSKFLAVSRNSIAKVLQLQYLSMPQQAAVTGRSSTGGAILYSSNVHVSYMYAIRAEITPIDLGPLLVNILSSLEHSAPNPSMGGIGGTNTGGETGNWGGTGGQGGGDYIDDGEVSISFSAKE